MLLLTPDAVTVVKKLTEAPDAEGVRISRPSASTDAAGAALQIELAAGPDPTDEVVDAEGAQLFLAPDAIDLMDGKVLDARIEGDEVSFAMFEEPEAPPAEPEA